MGLLVLWLSKVILGHLAEVAVDRRLYLELSIMSDRRKHTKGEKDRKSKEPEKKKEK
jgi:hypothetical protein